jgi:hypothetical protein
MDARQQQRIHQRYAGGPLPGQQTRTRSVSRGPEGRSGMDRAEERRGGPANFQDHLGLDNSLVVRWRKVCYNESM